MFHIHTFSDIAFQTDAGVNAQTFPQDSWLVTKRARVFTVYVFIYCVCMCGCFPCRNICVPLMCLVVLEERASDTLELEVQTIVSSHMCV